MVKDIKVFDCGDGWQLLAGRTAEANDRLSLKIAHPRDFWFHIAGVSGAHVVLSHPDHPDTCPKELRQMAASLAVFFSKGQKGGNTAVHWTTAQSVSKRPGAPPGQVVLKNFKKMQAKPQSAEELGLNSTALEP